MLDVFRTRPHFVEKIWGGQKLKHIFSKPTPYSSTGESWEVADLREGQSIVDSGEFRDNTLRKMVEIFGVDLIGTHTQGKRFPLLVKILDAKTDLSVQVHPGPKDVSLFTNAVSKDESWLFLDCDENSKIAHGFRKRAFGPTEHDKSFQNMIENGSIETHLRYVKVSKNDAIHVPPGTVHAICSGVALLEIQTPSDTTFRIYDYNRKDCHGQFRKLHVDSARAVIDFDAKNELKCISSQPHSILFDTPNYRVEVLNASRARWHVSRKSPQVIFNSGTEPVVINAITLNPFQTAIVPATVGSVEIRSPNVAFLIIAGVVGPLLNVLEFK